jgi:hypothetical protein
VARLAPSLLLFPEPDNRTIYYHLSAATFPQRCVWRRKYTCSPTMHRDHFWRIDSARSNGRMSVR